MCIIYSTQYLLFLSYFLPSHRLELTSLGFCLGLTLGLLTAPALVNRYPRQGDKLNRKGVSISMQIVSMSTNATLRGHLTQSVECSIQELISHSCLETLRSRARKYVCVTVSRCQHLQAVCNIGYNDAED